VGITACIFIMLYVVQETSYDKFNTNYNRIYRLEGDDFCTLPPIVGSHVLEKIMDVENVARLDNGAERDITYVPSYNPENRKEIVAYDWYADNTIFDVFTFNLKHGDKRTALIYPMTVVLSESTAAKLFGEEDPLQKTILINNRQFLVTGIIEDVKQSHVSIDLLSSRTSISKIFSEVDLNKTSSSWLWSATYLLISEKVDKDIIGEKINNVLSAINDGVLIDTKIKRFHLQPLKEIYFDEGVHYFSYGLHGNWRLIQVLVAVGVFILVLAGINYVNITTARSIIRAKEVAVKCIVGSSVTKLRLQLILESILISLISLAVSLTMVQVLTPLFNQSTAVNLQVSVLNLPAICILVASVGMGVGGLAGVFPAFYLTAIKPVNLIKRIGINGRERISWRGGLITFQFALSVIMIIAIFVNFRQLSYVRNATLGFNKEQIMTIPTPAAIPNELQQREAFRSKLLQIPGVEKISFTSSSPVEEIGVTKPLEINGVKRSVRVIGVDEHYLDIMGIALAQGQYFSLDRLADQMQPDFKGHVGGVVINESMLSEFGIRHPVGKRIYLSDKIFFEIIGVVKDFHFQSFHYKIEPLMMIWSKDTPWIANIKVSGLHNSQTTQKIESAFTSVWESRQFRYQFLNDSVYQQYRHDDQMATVIAFFTVLAIIIACLGLFALSSFMVSCRFKEIGVRKTLGASVGTIYSMLSWDFLKWILLAIVIASPVAWLLMNMWLSTFAYHITLEADVIVIAALLAIGIALLTVTGQSLKVARANPVDSLKYE